MSTSPPSSENSQQQANIPEIVALNKRRIRAIGACARVHIAHAHEIKKNRLNDLLETIRKAVADQPASVEKRAVLIDRRIVMDLNDQIESNHDAILAQSLMISAFSTFDAFLGLILRALYRENPALLHQIEDTDDKSAKAVKLFDFLACKSIDEAIVRLIDRDISNMLRESYDTIFSRLATRHGISTLKKFSNWGRFIEMSQRRNLLTHCDGIVNQHYIDNCIRAEAELDKGAVIGARLGVSLEYLHSVLATLLEISIKIAYILWRKSIPERIELAEIYLNRELYDLLLHEEWGLAEIIGEFAINLPGQKNDLQNSMIRINYAQALKWAGNQAKATAVLSGKEWSAAIRDLRLGVAVLREEFDSAAEMMEKIGKAGELLNIEGYRTWPLFREFRRTPQFRSMFERIYGESPEASEPPKVLLGLVPGENPAVDKDGDGEKMPETAPAKKGKRRKIMQSDDPVVKK